MTCIKTKRPDKRLSRLETQSVSSHHHHLPLCVFLLLLLLSLNPKFPHRPTEKISKGTRLLNTTPTETKKKYQEGGGGELFILKEIKKQNGKNNGKNLNFRNCINHGIVGPGRSVGSGPLYIPAHGGTKRTNKMERQQLGGETLDHGDVFKWLWASLLIGSHKII